METRKKSLYLLSLILLLSLASCGSKDENKNTVTTTPGPQFPQQAQTYTNCRNQQGYYYAQTNLCQDLQINYGGLSGQSNNYCNQNSRRNVFNRYCNGFNWNPRIVMNNISFNQNNLSVVCDLSDPTRVNSTISRIVHRGQTVITHSNFKAVINKSNNGYTTNLNVNLFNHQNTFIGSTRYTFSKSNRHQTQAYQVYGQRAQINCRPIQLGQNQSTSSSAGAFFSWSFYKSW